MCTIRNNALLGIGSCTDRVHFQGRRRTEAAHNRRDANMHTKRVFAGALVTVGLAAAGLSVGTGTALALPAEPHTWCPGDSMYSPTGPGANYVWDMNVCHTWQYVRGSVGNVGVQVPAGYDPVTFQPTGWEIQPYSNVWDGPNPPPGSAYECGNDLFGFPMRC